MFTSGAMNHGKGTGARSVGLRLRLSCEKCSAAMRRIFTKLTHPAVLPFSPNIYCSEVHITLTEKCWCEEIEKAIVYFKFPQNLYQKVSLQITYNKKILLRDRKRRTARGATSLAPVFGRRGTPLSCRGVPPVLFWLGYPPQKGPRTRGWEGTWDQRPG